MHKRSNITPQQKTKSPLWQQDLAYGKHFIFKLICDGSPWFILKKFRNTASVDKLNKILFLMIVHDFYKNKT